MKFPLSKFWRNQYAAGVGSGDIGIGASVGVAGDMTLIVTLRTSWLLSNSTACNMYGVVVLGHASCAPNEPVTSRLPNSPPVKYALLTFSSPQRSVVHRPSSMSYASAQNLITAGTGSGDGLGVNVGVVVSVGVSTSGVGVGVSSGRGVSMGLGAIDTGNPAKGVGTGNVLNCRLQTGPGGTTTHGTAGMLNT